MNICDIFYVRHSDINYSFDMFSHLGALHSLTTVRQRQSECGKKRNIEEEILDKEPCSLAYLYDNFVKIHGSQSAIFGGQQTKTVEVLNRAALSLPPPKSCPNCELKCETMCSWEVEKKATNISFENIYLTKDEHKPTILINEHNII